MLEKANNGFDADLIDAVLNGEYGLFQTRVRAESIGEDGQALRTLHNILVDESSIAIFADADSTRGGDVSVREASAILADYEELILALSGLVHWRLGEPSGNFDDLTGNGRTLTANGTIVYSRDSLAAAETDLSIQPNGSTGFGSIADAPWMVVTTGASWYGIVKGTGVTQAFLNRDNGTSARAWSVEVDGTGNAKLSLTFTTAATATFTMNGLINDGVEHWLDWTYDGEYVRGYIDAIQYLKVAETRTIASPTSAIRLGATTAGTKFCNYVLDEWGFVGRAISQAEIIDKYQKGSGNLGEINYKSDRLRFYYAISMPFEGDDGTRWAEWVIGTLMSSSTTRVADPNGITRQLFLQDYARILLNKKFSRRWSMGSGINPITDTNGVLDILADAGFDTFTWAIGSTSTVVPFEVEVADVGDTYLQVINDILTSYNFKPLWFKADGTGVIELKQFDSLRTTDETLATDSNSRTLANGIEETTEESEIFNEVILTRENPDGSILRSHVQNTDVNSDYNVHIYELKTFVGTFEAANQTELDNQAKHLLNRFSQPTSKLKWPTVPMVYVEPNDKKRLKHTEIRHALNINADHVLKESRIPFNGAPQENTYQKIQDVIT